MIALWRADAQKRFFLFQFFVDALLGAAKWRGVGRLSSQNFQQILVGDTIHQVLNDARTAQSHRIRSGIETLHAFSFDLDRGTKHAPGSGFAII
jgi:hypothetical protein